MANLNTPLAIEDAVSTRILDADAVYIHDHWNYVNVCNSFWRLYVNDGPGASIEVAGGEYVITPRRLHVIPAWVPFNCRCTRRVRHHFAHFDLVGLPGLMLRELFASPGVIEPPVQPPARPPTLAPTLVRLFRAAVDPAGHRSPLARRMAIRGVVESAVAHWFEQHHEAMARRFEPLVAGASAVIPAIRHIDHHLADPLTSEVLAGTCHMSAGHFQRLFRQAIGQTPARYVRERRIARAAQLLVFTPLSIDQIAESTGFADRFHFTRVFVRQMGLPPATYRRDQHA